MCDTLLSLGHDQRVVAIPERAVQEVSPVGGDGAGVGDAVSEAMDVAGEERRSSGAVEESGRAKKKKGRKKKSAAA